MLVVVGLGNPGPQYADTRHNIGFMAVDAIAQKYGTSPWKSWRKSLVCRASCGGEDLLLVKPQTFMNLSGEAVVAATQFYNVPPGQVIVIHDELDFEPGVVRIKIGGGHGGHNGLRSIIQHIGADY